MNTTISELMCLNDILGKQQQIATHVLQLVFLGDFGFRFPVAYFATNEAVASELNIIMWRAIQELKRHGFTVSTKFYICSIHNYSATEQVNESLLNCFFFR